MDLTRIFSCSPSAYCLSDLMTASSLMEWVLSTHSVATKLASLSFKEASSTTFWSSGSSDFRSTSERSSPMIFTGSIANTISPSRSVPTTLSNNVLLFTLGSFSSSMTKSGSEAVTSNTISASSPSEGRPAASISMNSFTSSSSICCSCSSISGTSTSERKSSSCSTLPALVSYEPSSISAGVRSGMLAVKENTASSDSTIFFICLYVISPPVTETPPDTLISPRA